MWGLKALILLLLLNVLTGIAVVYERDKGRGLALSLGTLEVERDLFNAEWSRLQLEQAWLADASRIERVARESLNMTVPEQIKVLMINPDK